MPKRLNKAKSSSTWINELVEQYAARPGCNETPVDVASISAPSAATSLSLSMEERSDKAKTSSTWIDELVKQYAARPSCNETSVDVASIMAPSTATNLSVSMEDENKMTDFLP